jgi:hypothetical protein
MNEEERLKEWAKPSRNEYITNSNGGMIHRDIWIKNFGEIPKGFIIHHKNGIKKDNRIENLECLSQKEHKERHPPVNKLLSLTEKKRYCFKIYL